MKNTQVLFQKVNRMIKRNWFAQGKIKVIPTGAEEVLKTYGYEVVDIKEFLKPPKEKKKFHIVGMRDKDLPKDENHPDYKSEPCFIIKDTDVLIDGLEQAKTFTNTVEIIEGLPAVVVDREKQLNLSDEIHSEIIKKIKLCCIFEATQDKLPRKKDPLRPSWIFKREYGITNSKKNDLLCKNLASICEQAAGNVKNNSVILDAFYSVPLEAHNKKIQLEATSELVITTRKKLKIIAQPNSTQNFSLPNLYPMDCTAGLNSYNFYILQDIYTPSITSKWPFVQIAFVHFDPTIIKNSIEEEVTESQIQGRSLLKGFSIAVAEARALFGHDIKELPEPVVVPVVQTDGKMFHFTIFQLNTLNLDNNSNVKNIFWNSPRMHLYASCGYEAGQPVLEGYNPDVMRNLLLFYNIE